MENKLIGVLNEFAYNLQAISPRKIENMEIILPWDNYKQLEYELNGMMITQYSIREMNKLKLQTTSGINFSVSCKEINDMLIDDKLKQCFKILSNDNNKEIKG